MPVDRFSQFLRQMYRQINRQLLKFKRQSTTPLDMIPDAVRATKVWRTVERIQSLLAEDNQKLKQMLTRDLLPPTHLALALYHLNQQRYTSDDQSLVLPQGSVIVDDLERFKRLRVHCELALIAYLDTQAEIEKSFGNQVLKQYDFKLLFCQPTHGTGESPVCAHYVAVSESQKLAVVGVRGTQSYEDVLVDLQVETTTTNDKQGVVHGGVGGASVVLYERLGVAARVLSRAGFCVELIGHSLGAGTAALLAIALREQSNLDNVKAVCFAPPPVVSAHIANKCADYCISIANGHDVIPRASPLALLDLQRQMFALNWDAIAKQEKFPLIKLAEEVRDGLRKVLDFEGVTDDKWSVAAQKWYERQLQLARDSGDESEAALSLRTPGKLYVLDGSKCFAVPADACLRLETSGRMATDHSLIEYTKSLDALIARGSSEKRKLQ